jgi:hypothetical protein
VDVGIERVWHIVVHYVRDTFDIDPASCDIRCDEHAIVPLTKTIERLQTLGLGEIAVKRGRIESELIELLTYLLGGVLHLGEHHHESLRVLLQPGRKGSQLVCGLNVELRVCNCSHRSLEIYSNRLRVSQNLL